MIQSLFRSTTSKKNTPGASHSPVSYSKCNYTSFQKAMPGLCAFGTLNVLGAHSEGRGSSRSTGVVRRGERTGHSDFRNPSEKTSLPPPALSLSSFAHAFRNSRGMFHATVVCVFGFVFEIELLVSGFRDRMCEASQSSGSPPSVSVSCAAWHGGLCRPIGYDVPPKTRPKTPVGGAGACGAVAGALDPPQCFSLHP